MFDISFTELMVIGAVALVVLGPEKLPKVARTVGHLVGRAQRYVNDVKRDINREMELDELRRLRAEMDQAAREVEVSVRQHTEAVRDTVNSVAKAVSGTATQGAQAVSGVATPPGPAVDTVPPAADTAAVSATVPDANAAAASAAARSDAGLGPGEPQAASAATLPSQKA